MNMPATGANRRSPDNFGYQESEGLARRRGALTLAAGALALLATSVGCPSDPAPTPAAAHHHVSRPRLPAPAASDELAASATAAATTAAPAEPKAATCVASWYGEAHRGRPTASGGSFDPGALTAAAWDVPFGTRLRVTHKDRAVVVTVNDRGPARRLRRCIDLSTAAFARLADLEVGLIDVTVQEAG